MKRVLAFVLFATGLCVPAMAQNYFPGTQTFQEPNYPQTPVVFTLTSQTSPVLTPPGVSTMIIQGIGASLTTATGALTQTQTTADASYAANIAGWTSLRFVTSGTFTGTSITLNIVLSGH